MNELYHLLEPKERVIYRARGAWILNVFFLVLPLFFAFAALFYGVAAFILELLRDRGALVTAWDGEEMVNAFLVACAVFAAGAAIFLAPIWCLFCRFSRTGALVTDHRLLGRSFERDAEVEAILLNEIEAIERRRTGPVGSLVVTGRAGQAMTFGPLHRAGRLATALAAAAGLHGPEERGGARALEALLRPGEKLLYRDPRRRFPRPPLPVIALMLSMLAMGTLVMQTTMSSGAALLALLAAIFLIDHLVDIRKLRVTMVAVTDRRVIYRSGGPGPEFKDIPLAGIEAVRCELAGAGGTAMITDHHGRDIPLHHLGDPRRLIERITVAAGARRPSFDSLLAWRGVLALGPTALLFMVAFRYLSEAALGTSWLLLEEARAGAEEMILNLLSFILALPAGLYLGTFVAMASLRPSVTAEEMHSAMIALKRRPASDDGFFRWWRSALRTWTALLYGRPPLPAASSAARKVSRRST